eukprot:TRINITY_DN905_c0_g1_i15.p2 TRINITY_DN905_c0_g1~~TRINITY_DN905_c0_g1_i15.p2  ORF type:complete len:1205 (-),score=565.17 TRINITY_DN905_c0_g1_i15:483-4097(-)
MLRSAQVKNMGKSVVIGGPEWRFVLSTQYGHVHETMAIINARRAYLSLLQNWPKDVPQDVATLGGADVFDTMIRLLAGKQASRTELKHEDVASSADEVVTDSKPSIDKNPLDVLKEAMVNILKKERENGADASTDKGSLSRLLNVQALSQLVGSIVEEMHRAPDPNASSTQSKEEKDKVVLLKSDRETMNKPNAELACWLVEIIIEQDVLSANDTHRLITCLFAFLHIAKGEIATRLMKVIYRVLQKTNTEIDMGPLRSLTKTMVSLHSTMKKDSSPTTTLQSVLEILLAAKKYRERVGITDDFLILPNPLKTTKGKEKMEADKKEKKDKKKDEDKSPEEEQLENEEKAIAWFNEFADSSVVLEQIAQGKQLPEIFMARSLVKIRGSKDTIEVESEHPYPKRTKIKPVSVQFATAVNVVMDNRTRMLPGEFMSFTADPEGEEVLAVYKNWEDKKEKKEGEEEKEEEIKFKFNVGKFYVFFPVKPSFLFDSTHMHREMTLSADKMTVTAGGSYSDYRTVLGDRPLNKTGITSFDFVVNKMSSANVVFGVAPQSQATSGYVGDYSSQGWAYYSSGYKYNRGNSASYGVRINEGDTVTVVYNGDAQELSFRVNGKDFGKAYGSVAVTGKDLYPCLTTYNIDDCVTLQGIGGKNSITKTRGNSNKWGYGFKVNATDFSEEGAKDLIVKHNDEFQTFLNKQTAWTVQMDQQLMECVSQWCKKHDKLPMEVETSEFDPTPPELLPYRAIRESCEIEDLRERLIVLQAFNKRMPQFLTAVDFGKIYEAGSLASRVADVRGLLLRDVKNKIWMDALKKTQTSLGEANITINRHRAAKLIGTSPSDENLEKSVFGQICAGINHLPPKQFRVDPSKKAWHVDFDGESSIDVGGPYRESFSQMIQELQSTHLNLLVKVPNAKYNVGLNRDKYIPNPALTTETHMGYYTFFGKLLGIALRTSMTLELNLPSLFWKQLVEFPVNVSDLEAIDQMCVQCNRSLIDIDKKGVTSDIFEDVIEETFVTVNSAGEEIELIENGKEVAVTFDNRHEYVRLIEDMRLQEFSSQMKATRLGVATIVPVRLLNLLTWNELQEQVCGIPDVDLVLLKKVTTYSGYKPDSDVVQNFWKCMESYTPEERQDFLRFVWGRSRMPLTLEEMNQQQNPRFILSTAVRNSNQALPESHTCFFQLDLPAYSTYEIMRERLLYAFTNCRAIDND